MQKLLWYSREKYYFDIIGLNKDKTTTNSKETRASTCMNLLLPQRIIMSYFIETHTYMRHCGSKNILLLTSNSYSWQHNLLQLTDDLMRILFIRPTCRDVLWYGAGVCPSGRLSVGLSAKLVNTIETEPFQLGPSNLVYTLLMTRGRTLLIFKVRGQRSRSQATHSC